MNVAERLKALAEGKKLRQPSFDPGKYIELKNDILADHAGKPFMYGEFILGPGWTWELYQEPQVLECWVVWFKSRYGATWSKSLATKQQTELALVKITADGGTVLHTEHVRVELPNKATEDMVTRAVDNAKQCVTGKAFNPAAFAEPKASTPLDEIIAQVNNQDWDAIVQKIEDGIAAYEEPKHTREMWVNVYPTDLGGMFETKQDADRYQLRGRIACVKVVVTYTDGEGL
jgi:hypothetical protein